MNIPSSFLNILHLLSEHTIFNPTILPLLSEYSRSSCLHNRNLLSEQLHTSCRNCCAACLNIVSSFSEHNTSFLSKIRNVHRHHMCLNSPRLILSNITDVFVELFLPGLARVHIYHPNKCRTSSCPELSLVENIKFYVCVNLSRTVGNSLAIFYRYSHMTCLSTSIQASSVTQHIV